MQVDDHTDPGRSAAAISCSWARRHHARGGRNAATAMHAVPDVIMPFPGGVVRSGSKIGSKYAGATASTNDVFCRR